MNYSNAIKENALYLLDEPENSLSAALQMKLKSFLEDSARFYHCQFIISTHSPFLLSMQGAKIYDLDSDPIGVKPWTELENVKTYYGFFKSHEKSFSDALTEGITASGNDLTAQYHASRNSCRILKGFRQLFLHRKKPLKSPCV